MKLSKPDLRADEYSEYAVSLFDSIKEKISDYDNPILIEDLNLLVRRIYLEGYYDGIKLSQKLLD